MVKSRRLFCVGKALSASRRLCRAQCFLQGSKQQASSSRQVITKIWPRLYLQDSSCMRHAR